MKRVFVLLALLMVLPVTACAQEAAVNYVEGEHYDVISPALRTRDPSKIEVAEFFWYGCGHCYSFEPLVSRWKKTLAADAVFVASPAIWNGPMEIHAQAFYTAQALGVLDTMHEALFAAMNVDRKRLASAREVGQLFAANGVDAEKFTRAFNSFGVKSQVRQATARAKGARITGTPELMVAGKYRISSRKAGGQAEMLKVARFLVEKERAAAQ